MGDNLKEKGLVLQICPRINLTKTIRKSNRAVKKKVCKINLRFGIKLNLGILQGTPQVYKIISHSDGTMPVRKFW